VVSIKDVMEAWQPRHRVGRENTVSGPTETAADIVERQLEVVTKE